MLMYFIGELCIKPLLEAPADHSEAQQELTEACQRFMKHPPA